MANHKTGSLLTVCVLQGSQSRQLRVDSLDGVVDRDERAEPVPHVLIDGVLFPGVDIGVGVQVTVV